MIDFDKFSIFSVLGKNVVKMTEPEYARLVLEKYDKCLADIKEQVDKKQGIEKLKQTIGVNTVESENTAERI